MGERGEKLGCGRGPCCCSRAMRRASRPLAAAGFVAVPGLWVTPRGAEVWAERLVLWGSSAPSRPVLGEGLPVVRRLPRGAAGRPEAAARDSPVALTDLRAGLPPAARGRSQAADMLTEELTLPLRRRS